MSDETTTDEMPQESTTEESTPPKPKKKPTPKKPTKKAKAVKKPAKKAAKKEKGESRPARDNARKVATASGGKLNTDKVRILRALKSGKPTSMPNIKKGCGIGEEAKYSGAFLKNVHALQEAKLIKVDKEQEDRAHTYTITERGTKTLQAAEAAFKEKA